MRRCFTFVRKCHRSVVGLLFYVLLAGILLALVLPVWLLVILELSLICGAFCLSGRRY